MNTQLSKIFTSLQDQQLPALLTLLHKAQAFAADSGVEDQSLIESRLIEDMHPLQFQVQAVLELSVRSLARLTESELPNVELSESSFAGLLARAEEIIEKIKQYDLERVDQNTAKVFEIPMGPEAKLSMTGEDYVLKFYLPNLYFHLTTTYNLLRLAGVPIGKLDFMGPVNL